MPKPAKGELSWSAEGPVARITLKGRERESYLLTACSKPADAEKRKELLAGIAARFRKAGVIDTRPARELLKTIATSPPALLPAALQVAGELAGGIIAPGELAKAFTFAEVAKDWTTGKLHKSYPDHVKAKDSTLDASRLAKLNALDLGGIRFGDIPVDEITLDHCQAVMGRLPEEAKRPATRRAYAQLLARVLALAVFPCRYIATSPIPKGFLPKTGKRPTFAYVYPNEDAGLAGWNDAKAKAEGVAAERPGIPLCRRVLFAFLAREGCRVSEAAGLTFRDVDLVRGVVTLDRNKTDDARAWALDPGVTRALSAWKELRKAEGTDRVFVDDHGRPLSGDSLAPTLRADLLAAGVTRRELHDDQAKNRRPLRVHDLRASFITIALANGKTEAWISDRTGHTSSQMINRYKRASRSAQELGLGALAPMDQAIPELRDCPAIAQNARPLGGDERPKPMKSKSGSTGTRTQDQRIKNPLL
jgi:integrase